MLCRTITQPELQNMPVLHCLVGSHQQFTKLIGRPTVPVRMMQLPQLNGVPTQGFFRRQNALGQTGWGHFHGGPCFTTDSAVTNSLHATFGCDNDLCSDRCRQTLHAFGNQSFGVMKIRRIATISVCCIYETNIVVQYGGTKKCNGCGTRWSVGGRRVQDGQCKSAECDVMLWRRGRRRCVGIGS